MLPRLTTPAPAPTPLVSDWLTSASQLVLERRAEPRSVAQMLLEQGGEWNPARRPLAVAGRIAETARASLPLACTMIHHARGALMLSLCGTSELCPTQMLWDLGDDNLVMDVGPPWTVTGHATCCCAPPDSDVQYVVMSHRLGHAVCVPTTATDESPYPADRQADPSRRPVTVVDCTDGGATVRLQAAPAQVHGAFAHETLTQVAVMGRLLEASAWYGALTRLADGLLATPEPDGRAGQSANLVLAEADALLSSSWAAIREAVTLWEHGAPSADSAEHHTARARTLARSTAATLLFGYVHDEYDHARRDPGAADAREQLVSWLRRRDWAGDSDVVAAGLRQDGPSW